jgi:single-strand DNA-binding protein
MIVTTLVGRLGKDCRVGTAGQTPVCNFTVAVDVGYGDKKQTLWWDCALFGKRAESKLPQYLTKGQQVAISGEPGTREYEGKTYLTLRVNELTLCGGQTERRQESASGGDSSDGFQDSDVPF